MRILLLAGAALVLNGCVAAKIVTIPVKVAAKTVEATADVLD